jgi:hypothetical protein
LLHLEVVPANVGDGVGVEEPVGVVETAVGLQEPGNFVDLGDGE